MAPAAASQVYPVEGWVRRGRRIRLRTRTVGQGSPAIVLHGGPDFDHTYLVPDMDRLGADAALVYYDQRERGESISGVRPERVSIRSELADLDGVRRHFGMRSPALVGHSWGVLLALEYALRHPRRVAGLVLANPGPIDADDLEAGRIARVASMGHNSERYREIMAGEAYRNGDPEAVAARYRLHFARALARADDYECLMARMLHAFHQQGSSGILTARAVEDRLIAETWLNRRYDLLGRLPPLRIPALVIAGDHDPIEVGIAERIASALPHAELVVIEGCGHFAYLERADRFAAIAGAFLRKLRTAGYR
jgi:proline iminopeptidase